MSTQRSRARALVESGLGTVESFVKRHGPTDRHWNDELLRDAQAADVIDVVTTDGAKLRVHAYGPATADPIVLIHGWTCRIEYWNPQINVLSSKHRVIVFDQRGHGKSDLGKRKASAEVLADDLAAVLQATIRPRKKAVLVGHSMGGMTIMAWAAKYPEQVSRYASAAILTNTGADELLSNTTVIPFLSSVKNVQKAVGRYVIGAPVPLAPVRPLTHSVFKARIMSPTSSREQVDFCLRIATACKGRARGAWGIALADIDVVAGLRNLAVPTSVVGGSVDNLTPPSHSVRLAEALDAAGHLDRLTILPGIGHMGNVEAPEAFNAEVVRMRTLSKRRRARTTAAAAG
ncbi:alpha/beta fold hydrolase [Antrihabitans sp. YC2-6]|uniref:alpha/beta fold hydrolase n=1 Tax=Antrihabitans sp. YC2-6 TaxID=2799498 RepID=UPI0018F5D4AF|nr:alpha/beta hydrolase [Antrihabitans sp. YC2-6]MBJ8347838.1 alpha/beta hydrolase [Antrihabitans sp. YC2-6]